MFSPIQSLDYPGWYEVPGFSKYCANEKGHVLTKKTGNVSSGSMSGRYLRVAAYRDGAKKHSLEYLHIIICLTFKGPPPFNGAVVLHKDNNRRNVLPSNLEWGTQSENIKQVWDDGLRVSYQEYPGLLDFISRPLKEKFKKLYSLESIKNFNTVPNKFIVKANDLNSEYSLYHLSFSKDLEKTWNPLIPAGTDNVEEEELKYGEPAVPRISVSPTLEKCFRAIYPNIDFYFKEKKYPHMDIYAYQPIFKGHERLVLPETLTKERWVWDAHVTDEHWILDSVKMVLVGRYRFYNTEDNTQGYPTRPFNDPKETLNLFVGPRVVKFIPLNKSPSLEDYKLIANKPPSLNW